MLTLETVKNYLRIDNNADDVTLNILIYAAENYCANAITNYEERTEAAAGDPTDTWTQAVALYQLHYIAHNYDNRTVTDPPADRLLTQLQAQGRAYKGE